MDKKLLILILTIVLIIFLLLVLNNIELIQSKVDAMCTPTTESHTTIPYPMFPRSGNELFYFVRNNNDLIINYSIINRRRWLEMVPNWEGIIPGKTQYMDAAIILSENNLYYQVILDKPVVDDVGSYQLTFRWIERLLTSDEVNPKIGDALFDRESGINTCIRITIQPIKLSELFSLLGEPSYVYSDRQTPIDSDQDIRWSIKIIYMEKGLLLTPSLLENNYVDKDLTVHGVTIFEPTEEGFSRGTHEGYYEKLRPWIGYGAYEEI